MQGNKNKMRFRLLYISVFLGLVFFYSTHQVLAQGSVYESEPQFFSAIQDVPLMPGLTELPDQTVIFDKPQGRIIESVAEIESAVSDEVISYYEETLPQLGWERIESNFFQRNNEYLKISFEDFQGDKFLRLIVMPK